MTLARLGRFQVERTLGSGSFATVWLARDEDLDAWVAIKLLAENWSLNGDARRRFIEEARALRLLDDDRIVRVYEFGHLDDDRPYMVMEYADRGTLEDRMRLRAQLDQPFSVAEALELSVEIAECLTSVHDHRIVHRDVKPSNVLFRSLPPERREALRREGRPGNGERTLLGDFGIARRLEGMPAQTMLLGSPQYMAPEQGDPQRARLVDYRSDIYSASVVLYELLAGRVPRAFRSMGELQGAWSAMSAVRIEQLRPDVPAGMAEAIHRSLARDPAERFDSAWEWRDALRGVMGEAERSGPIAAGVPKRSTAGVAGGSRTATRPAVGGTTLPPPPRERTLVLPEAHVSTAGASSAPVTAGGPAVATRPDRATSAGPPASATQPREGALPPRPTVARMLGVRLLSSLVLVCGLAVLVGVIDPSLGRRAGEAPPLMDLSRAFGPIGTACVMALLLAGFRLWRTTRRWMAIVMAGLAVVGGMGAAAMGVLAAWDTRTAKLGLALVGGGGLLAGMAGYWALKRIRRIPPALLSGAARGSTPNGRGM
jgi:protein kinase-like protein